mmetsp:Transcript_20999/g.58168  ORF Transcript_20999/g.58168 Transcript_20999/m.58168 type:complete len:271 (-) Transcript_20999:255-1067(-)
MALQLFRVQLAELHQDTFTIGPHLGKRSALVCLRGLLHPLQLAVVARLARLVPSGQVGLELLLQARPMLYLRIALGQVVGTLGEGPPELAGVVGVQSGHFALIGLLCLLQLFFHVGQASIQRKNSLAPSCFGCCLCLSCAFGLELNEELLLALCLLACCLQLHVCVHDLLVPPAGLLCPATFGLLELLLPHSIWFARAGLLRLAVSHRGRPGQERGHHGRQAAAQQLQTCSGWAEAAGLPQGFAVGDRRFAQEQLAAICEDHRVGRRPGP